MLIPAISLGMIRGGWWRMAIAGTNEEKFRELFSSVFGEGILKGSETFRSSSAEVSISVDATVKIGSKKILFEIDSGNYAKLLVGQYVLLNQIIDDSEEVLFVIVHYYKDYNEERTQRNLEFINNTLYNNKGIQFKVYTATSFETEILNYKTIEEYVEAEFS